MFYVATYTLNWGVARGREADYPRNQCPEATEAGAAWSHRAYDFQARPIRELETPPT
jgi:hypothetical protein